MKKIILALLILFSISFSSLIWEYKANDEINTKPLIFSNSLLVGSNSGSLYLINTISGTTIWEKKLTGAVVQPILVGSQIAVASKNGQLSMMGPGGNPIWDLDLAKTQNVTRIIGIESSGNIIYLSTDKGVYSVSQAGVGLTQIYKSSDISTPITVSGNSIIFGEGKNLVKISTTGQTNWKTDIGGVWLSKPVVDGALIYVGGLDKSMHAVLFNNGAQSWSYKTNGWVLSTPLVSNGIIYFGSNDGFVYALDKIDSTIFWKTKTPQAIESKPELGFLGGEEVLFVGSTNGKAYALNKQDGAIVWIGRANALVGDPLFYQNYVYFGSNDKSIYAFSTERACSIISPAEGETVGLKEVKVTGAVVSQSGSPSVDVQVNRGPFVEAIVNGDEWAYYIDPANELNIGVNELRCRVSDSAGTEIGSYTEIGIIRDQSITNSNLIVTTKGALIEGTGFEIFVNDGDDGSPVERFSLALNGISLNGSESVNVTVPNSGSYQLAVKKMGFNDAVLKLNISSTGINPLFIGAGILLMLVIVWQMYIRFIKK